MHVWNLQCMKPVSSPIVSSGCECIFIVSAVMGKAEGSVAREEWHGHVTALSVAPEFRRLGLAAKLMEMLEEISERLVALLRRFLLIWCCVGLWLNTKATIHKTPKSHIKKYLLIKFAVICLFDRKGGFFVDLFVRVSNQVAVNMYKRLGYSVYRTVIEYYSASNGEPDEDAYGEDWARTHAHTHSILFGCFDTVWKFLVIF